MAIATGRLKDHGPITQLLCSHSTLTPMVYQTAKSSFLLGAFHASLFGERNIEQAIQYVDLQLLTYEPEEYVLREIKTSRDLYEHRMPLKAFIGSEPKRILVRTNSKNAPPRRISCSTA